MADINRATAALGASVAAVSHGPNDNRWLHGGVVGEWGTANSGENWVRINLAQSFRIVSFRVASLYPGYHRPILNCEWSANNDNAGPWTLALRVTGQPMDTDVEPFTPVIARYWRIRAESGTGLEWYWRRTAGAEAHCGIYLIGDVPPVVGNQVALIV